MPRDTTALTHTYIRESLIGPPESSSMLNSFRIRIHCGAAFAVDHDVQPCSKRWAAMMKGELAHARSSPGLSFLGTYVLFFFFESVD